MSFKLNTHGWRLPKTNRTLEDKIPDDAYQSVGLPVTQLPEIETQSLQDEGGKSKARPAQSFKVDTSSWKLPKYDNEEDEEEQQIPTVPKQFRHNSPTRPALQRASKARTSTADIMENMRRLAGLIPNPHIDFATGTPHREMADDGRVGAEYGELFEQGEFHVPNPEEGDYALSEEQQRLTGLIGAPAEPHPVTDGRPLAPSGHMGILSVVRESPDDYVNRVLRDSHWLWEAPGGRAEPWSGSKDKAAETPIVRKGKTQGVVGKDEPPEASGEVDVGDSEIDYDFDPGSDDEEKKRKKSKKLTAEANMLGKMLRRTGRWVHGKGKAIQSKSREAVKSRREQKKKRQEQIEHLHQVTSAFSRRHGPHS